MALNNNRRCATRHRQHTKVRRFLTGCLELTETMCSQSKPYPPAFYTASQHEQSRMKLCIVCIDLIPRRRWKSSIGKRSFYIPDSATAQKAAEGLITGFDPGVHVWMPTSLCDSCRRRPNSAAVSDAVDRLDSDKKTQKLAHDCNGTLCDLCRTVNSVSMPVNQSAPPKPTPEQSFRYEIVAALAEAVLLLQLGQLVPEVLYIIACFLLFCMSSDPLCVFE